MTTKLKQTCEQCGKDSADKNGYCAECDYTNTPKQAHTPTPMYEAKTGNHQGLICREVTGENIAVVYDKAHVPFILRACNSHEELLEACKLALTSTSELGADEIEFIRKAIARAEANN